MALEHFRSIIHEPLNKYPYKFPYKATLVIFDRKSDACMANNSKDTNHTSNISRRVHFVRNGEKYKMHKIDCCEGGLQLSKTATKNVGENHLNIVMKYIMVRIDN